MVNSKLVYIYIYVLNGYMRLRVSVVEYTRCGLGKTI